MQRITPTSLTPEQYAQEQYHKQVKPPESCPNCKQLHCLEALGYYSRFITQSVAAVLEIWIRRFLCRHCRISVSCLPQFAQPYRLVNTPTVEAGFQGRRERADVQRWAVLIAAYLVGALPLYAVRWLVVVVVVYTAIAMLRSAFVERAVAIPTAVGPVADPAEPAS